MSNVTWKVPPLKLLCTCTPSFKDVFCFLENCSGKTNIFHGKHSFQNLSFWSEKFRKYEVSCFESCSRKPTFLKNHTCEKHFLRTTFSIFFLFSGNQTHPYRWCKLADLFEMLLNYMPFRNRSFNLLFFGSKFLVYFWTIIYGLWRILVSVFNF